MLARWPNTIYPGVHAVRPFLLREQGYYIRRDGDYLWPDADDRGPSISGNTFSAGLEERLAQLDAFALWVCLPYPLSFLLMPYSYSLWLHLDYWLEPWTPKKRL